MIQINLLPYRTKRKVENIRRQVTVFVLFLTMVLVAMFYYNSTLKKKIEELDTKITQINTEIVRVEKDAKEVARINGELKKLKQKIAVIKDLETKRKGAVRLLDDMTQMVAHETASSTSDDLEGNDNKPAKRLWFTHFQSIGDQVSIKGIALDNKTIADFMTRLESSKSFTNVNLKRTQKQKVKKLNLKSFEISFAKAPKKKDKKDKK
ncbi:MAG: PilN domain-containing protein [Candidatus Desulfatibia sp.]|uniref:PilN domain-containing protein n=1 Tax=Candidatus Desulfatibia sp. TaxID=3101189 RepID=UPI002F302DBF